jgi:8-hydroxy-5-deazaflavin:NADPH oxidoreductase
MGLAIGVLGTGMVGRTVGAKLAEVGHEVKWGTRSEGTYADAAAFGEIVVNATPGAASLDALDAAGAENLAGKTLWDISVPLQFGDDPLPSLFVANTDSLAERIQRAHPDANVVKALNTVNAGVMVDPAKLGEESVMFVCGDEKSAKGQVMEILETFGWLSRDIVDLGDITAARATEAYVLLWLRIWRALDTLDFNIQIVRPDA